MAFAGGGNQRRAHLRTTLAAAGLASVSSPCLQAFSWKPAGHSSLPALQQASPTEDHKTGQHSSPPTMTPLEAVQSTHGRHGGRGTPISLGGAPFGQWQKGAGAPAAR